MKILTAVLVLVLAACVALSGGCNRKYENVPPQNVGRILTPTGWEDKIYTSGQVDIGEVGMNNMSNKLVLIQTSSFTVKESFLGEGANPEEKEDHRVLAGDETPISLDIRIMFTCPDVNEDKESVKRLFTLGNPKEKTDRVMELTLESIYNEQAKLQVRGKIRNVCAGYENFSTAFKKREELNQKIWEAVAGILKERSVPLVVVDVQISNMKPDPLVWENHVKLQAAQAEIDAMRKIQEYLDENPSARMIFIANKLKEIASISSDKGNNFVVISGFGGEEGVAGTNIVPIVVPKKQPSEK